MEGWCEYTDWRLVWAYWWRSSVRKASRKFEAERGMKPQRKDAGDGKSRQHPNHPQLKPLPVQSAVSQVCASRIRLYCHQRVSYLVGALSPVSHKGLYQGWKQTFLLENYSTTTIPQVSFSQTTTQTIATISEHKPWKLQQQNHTCFGAYLYSEGTKHGNLHQLSVTVSRMTYFILPAHTGTGVSHSQHRKYSEEVLEKCNWMDEKGRN